MGSLFSCCLPDSRKQDEGPDERDRLLTDPTEVPADRTSLLGDDPSAYQQRYVGRDGGRDTRSGGGMGDMPDYGAINGSKHETSAWNRTLEKMASDVIDVSIIESTSNTLEQSEWMERSRMYAHKVSNSRVGSILKSSTGPKSQVKLDLRSAVDQAMRSLPPHDLILIEELSQQALDARRGGFAVQTDQQLIVQFNPSS